MVYGYLVTKRSHMKYLIIGITLIASCVRAQTTIDTRKQPVVFRSVNVVPMDSERILANQDVVIRDGMILAIGPTGKVKFDDGSVVVEAKGQYLMPGLAEMHAHIPPIDDVGPMKEVLMLFALNGITTIRGMLGHPRHLELREQVKRGDVLGPRIYTSGPSFNGFSVKSPAAADSMVRSQKAMGYDFLKLHPGLTIPKFNAIVKTANEVSIPFAGHVSTAVGVWRAIDANYATIDHLDGFIEGMVPGIEAMTDQEIGFFGMFVARKADLSQLPRLVNGLRDHHVWVVPTQCLAERWIAADKSPEELRAAPEMKYMDPKTLDQWTDSKKRQMAVPGYNAGEVGKYVILRRQLIKACNDGGVGLLLGSDAPQVFNVPGFSLHLELRYLVQSGLTPYEALKTGTVNVAAFFDQSASSGTVSPGKVADLVLLNANPLKDISATSKIAGVMLGDTWLPKTWIKAELEKLEKK